MSEQILHLLEDIKNDVACIEEHLEKLNGQAAKHSEWINRYDLRVAEEIPALQRANARNSRYIYIGIGAVTVVQIVIQLVFN